MKGTSFRSDWTLATWQERLTWLSWMILELACGIVAIGYTVSYVTTNDLRKFVVVIPCLFGVYVFSRMPWKKQKESD